MIDFCLKKKTVLGPFLEEMSWFCLGVWAVGLLREVLSTVESSDSFHLRLFLETQNE